MLKPIPSRILKHNITLNVCSGVDRYQNPTWETPLSVSRVVVHPTNETKKTKANTEVVLRGICFIDARLSIPSGLDLDGMKARSESNGHSMTLDFNGDTYTVMTVDTCYDDTGVYHHAEVGLV